jgi:U3 small nucleolar RNA-associated protein 12
LNTLAQFECIQKLEGHHGEVWALAVSHRGNFVATGSHDKSIRIWEKTDEPVRSSLHPFAFKLN